MSVVVVGVNHRSVPIDVLERMTIAPSALPKALDHVTAYEHIAEAVILSTCNRIEIYAVCETFHGALADLHDFLADISGVPVARFAEHLFTAYDEGAVAHLFDVAAGLDSAVVGETEILGQVRSSWESARAAESCGPHLGGLFRHALETGKRARTETGIARGTASVSHAAVELAADRLGSLADRSVLVLGAGEIGVSMATALQNAGVRDVLVANRTRQKASALAARIGGTYVALHELPSALERVDVLLTATSSLETVLLADDIRAVMTARLGRELVIVDTGLPRDVDPDASQIDGVTLLDLVAIKGFVERGLEGRRQEIDHVREIVLEELNRYIAGASARQVAPVISSLRRQVEALRVEELAKLDARFAGLDPAAREAVETLTKQLLAKVLHGPTVRLKSHAGSVKGQRMADAVRVLFDLDES